MKQFIIAVSIFLFTFTGVNISSASAPEIRDLSNTAALKAFTPEEFIYIRVLISGHWWTYVYALDGSFIVAIPDDDGD